MTRQRWILVAAAVWGAALLTFALVSHSDTTVAEQQSPAAARPAVDRGITAVLSALDRSVVGAIGGYERTGRCDLTAVRDGVQYARTLDLYVTPGRDTGLLDRLTRRLPASFHTVRVPSLDSSVPEVLAHPDPFVRLTVAPLHGDRGHLRAVADTGCRPTTANPYPEFQRTPSRSERARVASVFTLFDVTPRTWSRATLSCADGSAVTVRATGLARESLGPLPETLHADPAPVPGTVLVGGDDRYVYQDHGRDLVISTAGDRLSVTLTTHCR
ncbi:MAG: hypothetical protein WCA46_30455 [Actinocatenispora sp.]